MKTINSIIRILPVICLASVLSMSCSTTSRLPDDECLYTGIESVNIDDKLGTDEEAAVIEEMNGALDYAPNNSFFGSSYIRTPLPVGLWVYNSMNADSVRGIKKWFFNTFSATPRTISSASPATRSKVATNVLQNYGYFQGKVDFRLVPNKKNPRKQKIAYDVHLGHAYSLDSVDYVFPKVADSIIQSTLTDSYLHSGNQFSVVDLQSEKVRISSLLHNNGYYYYRPDYVKYYADSINVPGKVRLLVQQDESTPARASKQWRFGKVSVFFRDNTYLSASRRGQTIYDDTIHRPRFDIAYQGKKVPVRIPIVMRNFKFWTGMKYNADRVNRTLTQLTNLNCLSNVQFTFTPTDTTDTCSVLDVRLDAIMDKLIDTELDFNFTQKSNRQIGPDASFTLSKRNAFRNGEKLSLTLRGSYYWQVRNRSSKDYNNMDSYDWGVDLKLDYPWIVFPYFLKRNFYRPTSTNFVVSFTRTNLAKYLRYNQFALGAEYKFHQSEHVTHTFSPLRVDVLDLRSTNDSTSVGENNAWKISLQDALVPSMIYTFSYDNSMDPKRRFFTNFSFTFKEAGNIISGIQVLSGKKFDEMNKKFGKMYSQFLKFQMELRNKYKFSTKHSVATRIFAGFVWNYGNSRDTPLSDVYYSGGAYSIRAFPARSLGPGHNRFDKEELYVYRSGDVRLELNAEYRFPLIGNLNGALFVDAGNVWKLKGSGLTSEDAVEIGLDPDFFYWGEIKAKDLLREIALGTGFGFRYDMEFLVLRLDFGVALHAPYDTGKKGYYNIPRFFKDGLGINFAVGYPF